MVQRVIPTFSRASLEQEGGETGFHLVGLRSQRSIEQGALNRSKPLESINFAVYSLEQLNLVDTEPVCHALIG